MNVYEAMRVVRNEFVPHTIDAHLAMDEIGDVTDAYDALAPDWANAPKNAMWYSIDSDGAGRWGKQDPSISGSFWLNVTERAHTHVIPLGIDWRLCKWSREGAK